MQGGYSPPLLVRNERSGEGWGEVGLTSAVRDEQDDTKDA